MRIARVKTFIVDGGFRPWTFVKIETGGGDGGALRRTDHRQGPDGERVDLVGALRVLRAPHRGHRLQGDVGDRLGPVGHSRQGARRARVAAPGRPHPGPTAALLVPLRVDAGRALGAEAGGAAGAHNGGPGRAVTGGDRARLHGDQDQPYAAGGRPRKQERGAGWCRRRIGVCAAARGARDRHLQGGVGSGRGDRAGRGLPLQAGRRGAAGPSPGTVRPDVARDGDLGRGRAADRTRVDEDDDLHRGEPVWDPRLSAFPRAARPGRGHARPGVERDHHGPTDRRPPTPTTCCLRPTTATAR